MNLDFEPEITTQQIKFPFASIRPVAVAPTYGSGIMWRAASGCRYYGPKFWSRRDCLDWIYSA